MGEYNTNGSAYNTKNTGQSTPATGILYQNIPNPYTSSCIIEYEVLKQAKMVELYIYDLQGNQLKSYKNLLTFGKVTINIGPNDLRPGMFYYSLIIDHQIIDTKRMILTR